MKIILSLLTVLIIAFTSYGQKIDELGTVLAHSKASTKTYLGGPSIVILPDGTYVASHSLFGPESPSKKADAEKVTVYHSKNKGKSWKAVARLKNIYWANLFYHKENLYIMGASKAYGDLVIKKSSDGGKTWTEPTDKKHGLLRNDFEYHSAPVPMVEKNGRIYRAVEVRSPASGWGINFETLIVSAPVDADLLDADSWTTSNRLHYNQEWIGSAWLEGNVVLTPENDIVNILRVHYKPHGGMAAVVRYDENQNRISFNPERDFIHFPGGCKKFTIRYDKKSKLYWTLSNYIRDIGHNPERTRNCLAISSSPDLLNWTVHEAILYHPDVEKHGFQYADWQFAGEDIIALVRVAYDDEFGGADNQHNANYILFKRISDFRNFTKKSIATYSNETTM
jgi:hypothetical protein